MPHTPQPQKPSQNLSFAFITGASSGIGLATAKHLAARGFSLILVARRYEKLQKIAQELSNQFKVACYPFGLDLRNKEAIQSFVSSQTDLLSRIDVLINNAGLAREWNWFQDTQLESFDAMIETNVTGVVTLTRLLLPFLLKNQRGHLVVVGSTAGHYSYQRGHVYCGTKHFVRSLWDSLRHDLVDTPIRTTCISPGMVETEFSPVRYSDPSANERVYKDMTPLSPEDIAEAIGWCLDRPAHVNISEITLYPKDQASPFIIHRHQKDPTST